MSDRQLMRAVRAACEELVAGLEDLGWEFEHDPPLHPPGVVTLEHLEGLEVALGPLPAVVVDFWLEVGGIDLSGEHPDWDVDTLTPLVIEAPIDDMLEEIARENAEGDLDRIPVSPDFALSLPDGDVITADGHVALVDHLREVLLEHAGITGWADDEPVELQELATALPRF